MVVSKMSFGCTSILIFEFFFYKTYLVVIISIFNFKIWKQYFLNISMEKTVFHSCHLFLKWKSTPMTPKWSIFPIALREWMAFFIELICMNRGGICLMYVNENWPSLGNMVLKIKWSWCIGLILFNNKWCV